VRPLPKDNGELSTSPGRNRVASRRFNETPPAPARSASDGRCGLPIANELSFVAKDHLLPTENEHVRVLENDAPWLILLAATAAFLAPAAVRAEEPEVVIRPGMYKGRVARRNRCGSSSRRWPATALSPGIIHFDKSSNFPDAIVLLTGELSRRGAITIKRDPKNDPQVSKAGAPHRDKGHWIWKGETTGGNLDKAYPFELHIPLPK